MSSLLKKYGIPMEYEDGLPVIPDIKPTPNYNVGTVLAGRYEIIDMLNGGVGDVYHCFDRRRKVDVALKTIVGKGKTDRLSLASFYGEVERRLMLPTHPNVITLKRVEVIDGYYFIVSEWIAGDELNGNSMTQWLICHNFSLLEVVNFMQQMCTGLAHCHKYLSSAEDSARPYTFGDLKPDNILIDREHILKLADFSGGYTPGWNAPEQAAGSNIMPDVRTDIFCFGKIASAMLSKIGDASSLRDAVDDLLRKCLHPKKERRISSLADLEEELATLCERFACSPYIEPKSDADTFMDYYNRLASKINFGQGVSIHQSLSTQAYTHSYLRRKYVSMADFMEMTAGNDFRTLQATAYAQNGDLDAALKELPYDMTESVESLYCRATLLYMAGKTDEALHNLDAAILKELYLPACDLKANILLDFPTYATSYTPETSVMLEKLKHLPKERMVGYLLNQVIAKYEMLAKRFEYAASYFRRSLQYANFNDEWLTLYYYASCESRLKNSDRASEICNQAIMQITDNPHYRDNYRQCVILLFCFGLINDREKMFPLVEHIQQKFEVDYSGIFNLASNTNSINEQS